MGVYTQPDRPAARSKTPVASPVKRAAQERGLPVFQPNSLRRAEAQGTLKRLAPDLLVLTAYGLILPQAALDIPRYGGLNVHPSLLPRYRGPAPIVGALLADDAETGVSIMRMDAGMDTGPILAQTRLAITDEDSTLSLTEKLAHLGAELLVDTIEPWIEGRITPQPQDEGLATYTRMLSKEDGRIDWRQPAAVIACQVRAYQPWPGAYTYWRGRRLNVLAASPVPGLLGRPGRVVNTPWGVVVETPEGFLRLQTVQLEGKRPLQVDEFLRGAQGFISSWLDGETPAAF